MSTLTRLVVLGGGFGGLEAVLELERRFRNHPEVEILLVSDTNFFLFTPLLPQIVSSYVEPRHIVQSLRDIRRHRQFRFLRASVTGIALGERTVRTTAGDVSYDYLVIALGSAPNFFGIPGAAEHAYTLRSLEDAVVLRDHLLDLFEHADHMPDPQRRRALLALVVIGGGYTGVELVAELHDLVHRHLRPRYRGLDPGDVTLLLLEATGEILAGVDPDLARLARRKLQRQGIVLRTQARVTRISPGAVEVAGAPPIPAGLVIWTAGVQANPLVAGLPAKKHPSGRLVVDRYLQLPGHPRVFAIGDNAVVEDAPPEQSPRIAPVALAQGRLVAENLARAVARQAFVGFEFVPQGMLVSLGMNNAVINIKGFKLAGYLAWLIWNAVHLLKLVGLKKQLQVALDWSLATLFPRDTSIIRRPHRCPLCHPPPGLPSPRF